MGLLKSKLFTTPEDDPSLAKLEACLVSDAAHITPGSRGNHVKKIQIALNRLSAGRENFTLKIDGMYGSGTADAVKRYKNALQRQIITRPSQQTADNIVGKRTIKSLDDEMDILENESLAVDSRLVSTTKLGSGPPHDHSKCPKVATGGFADRSPKHHGTPINPQGFGRKVNIGGEGETDYLGFQDFQTKTNQQQGGRRRDFTERALGRGVASDVFLRSTPIDAEVGKEIARIAMPACRLTVASPPEFLVASIPFLMSLGVLIEDITIFDEDRTNDNDDGLRVFVIAMRGDGRFDKSTVSGPTFPPAI